ncbi:MAG TPA: glycosyltransferase family 2 protein [Vicinamibacterales bacterium]|jgi:glycosyltransferase involved in cell wall biosynthesis|nr:glycosyltransferase family 2 protein [Vicinamibacterales bacterium]
MVTIAAVIPAFNEGRHVAEVVRGTAPFAVGIVVVDDGSADDTAARAREAGAVVLRHETNRGKGCAIRTGLAHALALPCSHVLLIDADLQHDPAEIPRLVACAEQGRGDFVLGERDFRKEAMPRARYYSNTIGSAVLARFIGAPVRDSQSGLRLVRADLLRRVPLTATGYEIETEMLIKLVRAGARLDRVTVRRLDYTGARSKIRPVRDTFRTCMLAVRYRYLAG